MKGILFNGEMVQAILEGRKTVTRRKIKLDLGLADTDKLDSSYLKIPDEYGDYHDAKYLCRYQVGDILYVRETFGKDKNGQYHYRVDYPEHDCEPYPIWHPSIHMPKSAARIFLKVTNVKVERLKDMTLSDYFKEGFSACEEGLVQEFKRVWNSTIKKQDIDKYNWESNPFVWVIEFERVIPE